MSQLPNHLRSHRKRIALSQSEVAFLMGAHGGAKVCRYERFARNPSLETALAFEVLLQKPARELFPGLYRKIEKEIAARTKILIHRMNHEKPGRKTTRRRQALTNIISSESNNLKQS